jgi:CSLREA domain-containing protein
MRPSRSLLAVAALTISIVAEATAATLTVTNLNDSGFGSLRDRIAVAAPGDTIVFGVTGTITLFSGSLQINKNLTISGPGASSLTIQRDTAPDAFQYRIFYFDNGTFSLSGVRITNGNDPDLGAGGGIYNQNGNLTVNDCVITGNTAGSSGGGIVNLATMTLNNCTISNNTTGTCNAHGCGNGGGILNGGTLTMTNCVVTGNHSSNAGNFNNLGGGGGGGIENYGSLTMIGCTVSNNVAQFHGGGLVNYGEPGGVTAVLTNCTFTNNQAQTPGDGGAIDNYTEHFSNAANATVTVNGCTFNQNSGFFGGAVENSADTGDTVTATFQNCTFSGNTAGVGGGVFYNSASSSGGSATLTVVNCTFNGNTAASSSYGSSIANSVPAVARVGSSILKKGGGTAPNLSGSITSQGYNLCDDAGAGALTNATDRINTDPLLDPFGLQDNGGPTKTIALVDGSPALDQGKSFGLTTDQRGQPRPIDNLDAFPAAGGDGSDIGAYEAPVHARQSGVPSFNVSSTDDHDDGICTAADCTLREAIRTANEIGPANMVSFPSGVTGTITLDRNLGEISITDPVTVTGPGARFLAVSGGGYIRVFSNSSISTVSISGLTIRDGSSAFANTGETKQGGAVYNVGSLAFSDCAFTGNYARGGDGATGANGGAGQGGAIYNGGTLSAARCLFYRTNTGNIAAGGNGGSNASQFGTGGAGGDGQGGAIFNAAGATFTANNSTFEENSVGGGTGGNGGLGGGNGGTGAGSAIFSLGTMTLNACTMNGNGASGGTGGTGSSPENNGFGGAAKAAVVVTGGNAVVRNTLIAGNSGTNSRDVDGAFLSPGYNLIGSADHSTGFADATDQKGTDSAPINPQLGSLQNNGGPTDTMALLANSPALDKGKSFGLTTDQRGFPRTLDSPYITNATNGDGTDIGAFEADAPQSAVTLVVNTVADHDDGACGFLDCTLREAINAANSLAGDNTITFAPGVTGIIRLGSALPDVSTNVTIAGPGARLLSVNGNAANRVFVFSSGTTSAVSGLTIENGLVAPATEAGAGGGIINQANLTLTDCIFYANRAQGADAIAFGQTGYDASGGAIYNNGILGVSRSTFNVNACVGGRGGLASNFPARNGGTGGNGNGGAIYNDIGGTLNLTNCTLAGNNGTGGAGGSGSGVNRPGGNGGIGRGGVFNRGAMTITACTVSGNSGTGGAGGSGSTTGSSGSASGGLINSGTAIINNTISAGNTASGSTPLAPDASGSFTSNGYNLIGDGTGSSGWIAGDRVGPTGMPPMPINAMLGSLQNNGGPTDTMALLSGSPAIDHGGSGDAPAQDQRYYLRNGPADIGAFEFGGTIAPISVISRKTHSTAGTFDIGLPLTGPVGTECRIGTGAGGQDHQLIMTFPVSVTVGSASAVPDPKKPGATGSVSSSTVSGSQVTVNLTSVTNAQTLTINLNGVNDGVNTSNLNIPMGVLLGDANSSRRTDAGDVTAVRNHTVSIPTDNSTARFDVNLSGRIDAGDVTATRNATVTVLP